MADDPPAIQEPRLRFAELDLFIPDPSRKDADDGLGKEKVRPGSKVSNIAAFATSGRQMAIGTFEGRLFVYSYDKAVPDFEVLPKFGMRVSALSALDVSPANRRRTAFVNGLFEDLRLSETSDL